MIHTSTSDADVVLPGLDGTNPLGFLAALGMFRVAAHAIGADSTRMAWTRRGGTWCPRLVDAQLDAAGLLDLLEEHLTSDFEAHPVRVIADLTAEDPIERAELFEKAVSAGSHAERMAADWIAALGSDACEASATSQLQTARRDYFQGNLESVIERTRRDHLERSMLSRWDYADALDNQSLHLDPAEDRRHAHQWHRPSGDPDRKKSGGMLGANRLAIEALPLFPSFPAGDGVQTAGFSGRTSRDTRWTWPIWDVPLATSVLPSLLRATELQSETFTRDQRAALRGRGVAAAYRTDRILVGKTPNFTPPRCLG